MQKAVSVCIPARNEANNIGRTIDSVLRQHDGLELEVLVCANACTDDTERVVEEIASEEKRVKLITSQPGKPNAWNALIRQASYDDQVFIDGDVLIGKGSIRNLVDFMHDRRHVAATSKMRKIIKSMNPVELYFNLPFTVPNASGICGRLYSVKREQLLQVMKSRGFYAMPKDIINEDTWLSLVLETRSNGRMIERKWGYDSDAIVYYQPPDCKDRFKRAITMAEGMIQLAREYPQLGSKLPEMESIPERFLRRLQQWKNYDSWEQKLKVPIFFVLRKLRYEAIENRRAMRIAKANYTQGRHTNLWYEPVSTKQKLDDRMYNRILSAS